VPELDGELVQELDPGLDAGPEFRSAADVAARLRLVDYLPDDKIAGTVYLGERLVKPILVEGPAGTGKTELAKSVARATNARLIRLQCYEGLDEAKALYEWDYRKQLLRIQATRQDSDDAGAWANVETDIFGEEYLLTRPLLEAIRATDRVVLLVDEVDRLDVETEALLLEVLSDYQVSIPELGTIVARRRPLVFLTSNNSRELSEALKRRCLFLHIDYPSAEREREIILARVPGISERLASQVAEIVRSLRSMDLKKPPSVSETLDWAQTLMILGGDRPVEKVTDADLRENLHVLLKNQGDIAVASKRFGGLPA
jgi:MoxR-like ATPase